MEDLSFRHLKRLLQPVQSKNYCTYRFIHAKIKQTFVELTLSSLLVRFEVSLLCVASSSRMRLKRHKLSYGFIHTQTNTNLYIHTNRMLRCPVTRINSLGTEVADWSLGKETQRDNTKRSLLTCLKQSVQDYKEVVLLKIGNLNNLSKNLPSF
jgi:hypothetical protein